MSAPEDIYLNQTGKPGKEAVDAVLRQDITNAIKTDVIEHDGTDTEVFIFKDGSVAYWDVVDGAKITTGNTRLKTQVSKDHPSRIGPDAGHRLNQERYERGTILLEKSGFQTEESEEQQESDTGLEQIIRRDIENGHPLSVIRQVYGLSEDQFVDIVNDLNINRADIEKHETQMRLKLADRDMDDDTYDSIYGEHVRLKNKINDISQPEDQVFSLSDLEAYRRKYPGLFVDKNVVEQIGVGNTKNKPNKFQNKNVMHVFPSKIYNGSVSPEDQYLADPRVEYDRSQQAPNRLLDRMERRRIVNDERRRRSLENDELSFDSPEQQNSVQNHDDAVAFDSPEQQDNEQNRDDAVAFDSATGQNTEQNRDDVVAFDSAEMQDTEQNRDDAVAFDSPEQQNSVQNHDDAVAFDSAEQEHNEQNHDDAVAFDSAEQQHNEQNRDDAVAFDSAEQQHNEQNRDDAAAFNLSERQDDGQNHDDAVAFDSASGQDDGQNRDDAVTKEENDPSKHMFESFIENSPINNYEKSTKEVFESKNRDNRYEEGLEGTFDTQTIDDSTEREVDKIFSGEYSQDEPEKSSEKKDNSLDSMVSNATDSLKSVIPIFDKDGKKNTEKDENTDNSNKTPDVEVEIEKSLSSDDITEVTNEQLLDQFIEDIKKYDATTEEQLKERAESYDNALRTNALFRKQVACGYVMRQNSDAPEKPLYPSQEKAIKDKVNNIYDDSKSNINDDEEKNDDDLLKNIRKNLDHKKDEFDKENKGIDDATIRHKLQQLSEQNNPQQKPEDDGFDDNPKAMSGRMRKGKRFRGRGVDVNAMNNPHQMESNTYVDPDEQILETGVLALMKKRILEANGIDPNKISYQTSNSVWS